MFQPTTECVDSLTIDDVTGQAVPESGTGHTECSVADGCEPHSRLVVLVPAVDVSALIGAGCLSSCSIKPDTHPFERAVQTARSNG